ncbi:MAG: Sir2 silent information regulator family NAD-dependent deacetylase [Acetatifactor sp.]|jgi:NAD-dependent SIR2 family protein deacetylase|nr:Sir2 silent information regulator family NAD-dependent deacetylase [Acetatifactor sp.]
MKDFDTTTDQLIESREKQLHCLKEEVEMADAVIIGAGAGLSTSAGFAYTGERFRRYFGDFSVKYDFHDMYSGGFYPYTTLEEKWAYWSRYVYINRYMKASNPVYEKLYQLIDGRGAGETSASPRKHYFVLTTNVDHQFQKAGFKKRRIFYTQGDYGLWQCSKPCHKRTYDNKERIVKMVLAQGFQIGADGELIAPRTISGETDYDRLSMFIPTDLIPYCPVCGEPMSMNLRADDTFVEDAGWNKAADCYADFMHRYEDSRVLYLELGVGGNTPGIIKYPFWQRVAANEKAVYTCINYGAAFCPKEIEARSICIDGDIGEVLERLL